MKTKLITTAFMAIAISFFAIRSVDGQQTLQVSSSERFIAYSLYNFSKLIKWPSSGTTSTFEIAVVGDKRVYLELQKLAQNKKVGNANYDIRFFKDISEISDYCHMVYLSGGQSGKLDQLACKDKNVLIVTERGGMTKKGSTISFTTDTNGKMGFEIAKGNAAKNQLIIHMQLERMAMSVI